MPIAFQSKLSTPKIIRRIPSHLNVKLGLASRSTTSTTSTTSLSSSSTKKPLLVLDGESSSSDGRPINSKVPKGSLAVYVGPQLRRFVIPISFLSMPDLRLLMESVAEEYGCDHHGAIQIPCDEDYFLHILMSCSQRQQHSKKLFNIHPSFFH